MGKLSPRQIDGLANRICGDAPRPFDYRTATQLDEFFEFCEVDTSGAEGSRFYFTQAVLRNANQTKAGTSGLPKTIEAIVKALLDPREFSDDAQHRDAVDDVAELLRPAGAVAEYRDPDVILRSVRKSRGQQALDEQIHTVFGKTLDDDALAAARTHYRKAKRYIDGADVDYENACKEAMCAIEAIVLTLVEGKDLVRELRKLANEGHIPKPISEMIIKLYAYRGNEPGISHGSAEVPEVGKLEAELLFNLAGAIGAYIRQKLADEKEPVEAGKAAPV